nr:PREDICTED: uncharacterized protein LOC108222319 isoform X2 [Daucus carota subsp. sativus]
MLLCHIRHSEQNFIRRHRHLYILSPKTTPIFVINLFKHITLLISRSHGNFSFSAAMDRTIAIIILLLSRVFLYTNFSMRILGEFDKSGAFDMELLNKDDYGRRTKLHEVHSGSNPISNSLPVKGTET